jgi:uncharacterized protein
VQVLRSHLIVYVRDPEAAARFWRAVLACDPDLEVPGMTEFVLGPDLVLGLMPEAGILRLLPGCAPLAGPGARTELYLVVDDPAAAAARALAAGARELSPLSPRDWGHDVVYVEAPDGVVLALARPTR